LFCRTTSFTSSTDYAVRCSSFCGSNNLFLNNTLRGAGWVSINGGSGNAFNNSAMGNRYLFANGSAAGTIFDIRDENGDGWADTGAQLPFNQTTLGSAYFSGNMRDGHPSVYATIGNASNISANGISNLSATINGNSTFLYNFFTSQQ
jgi:hypothetical protein